ncbi:hypothetical protein [Hymenobacter cellulosilyticus]|uniref:Uncharacterized protein n=1 Tax=Hymenobacter cellulosilyticus TaxID=2932248 RepID=A0A8T9Q9A5_9BACT|nr:hypothetical protein [Hymenobacter cellulosilyticus]UOQ73572.1 hypothetical protein MUN79_06485 [Hymenobacter cellulosilyticus]
MNLEKLLTIDSSFVLTGLGVLVRSPAGLAAEPLRRFTLYTTLAVKLVFADGQGYSTTASVEEIARPSSDDQPTPPEPALLLHLTDSLELPPGTEVWLTQEPAPAADWL